MVRHTRFYFFSWLIVSIFFVQAAYTQNVTGQRNEVIWTGNASDEWNEALNWSNTIVPNERTDITIPQDPQGGNFPFVRAGTTAVCHNLSIAEGASLQIRGFLTVNGNLVNTDETALTILSDATGTGSLIFNSENVVATVQRYLSDGVNHFIGAPVDGVIAGDLFFNDTPQVFLYQYNENTGDWSSITVLSTPLLLGTGYSVYVDTSVLKMDVTAEFKGTLRAADLHLSSDALTYTQGSPYPGYNLISNPFSSALSWDLGHWQADNVTGCVWLWNGSYNYLFRNAHGMGNLSGGIIPSSQAFLVKASGSNPELTLSAEDRVHSGQNFYKQPDREDAQYFVIKVQALEKEDEVWVAFCDGCTTDYDTGWDTEKLFGKEEAPQLYVDDSYSVDALPPLSDGETVVLPLNFEAGVSGRHTLLLTATDTGTKDGFRILLKDLRDGTEQIMVVDNPYIFEADTADDAGRFELWVTKTSSGIVAAGYAEDYLIYSSKGEVVIKPLSRQAHVAYMVQVTDVFGRTLIRQKVQHPGATRFLLPGRRTYVIIRLFSDGRVITKKLFVY